MDCNTNTSPITEGKTPSPRLCWVEEELPEPMQRDLTPGVSSEIHLSNKLLDSKHIVEDATPEEVKRSEIHAQILALLPEEFPEQFIQPMHKAICELVIDYKGNTDSYMKDKLEEQALKESTRKTRTQKSSGKKRFWRKHRVEPEAQEQPAPRESFGCFPLRLMLRRLFKRNK